VIRIEDEGPGLTAQDIARAFRPFMTLTAKSDGPLGSHGLGLSIVRSIVERHGGTVTARNSQNGPGSVFELRLPRPTPSREPGE
jgi:signal transduction histidine kinase